ncbi:FAD-linked oxidase C-terminal domain-containing protein [Microvirga sp. W0021]|uniref:D-lactate dehydrogenase (cytochrome) n=2 Tax=Hohaiivirga grylli TaxID=3133970 RepID=A0ABV0BK19_9HYPH
MAAQNHVHEKPSADRINTVVSELQTMFGDRLTTNMTVREQHANTTTWVKPQPADAVVYPETTEEVSSIVKLCAANRVPVIPFGTGTSFEGHVNAPYGGICVDTSRMNNILDIYAEDLNCRIQPGVTREELNDYLRDKGLFFPIDPGANAAIGGMVGTRASGTNAVRYGTMKDNVLSLTVVLPNGDIVKTASRAKKSSAGYDLTRLFVGSEGTLGIITEIVLKLHGQPEAISAAICPFPTVKHACDAVIAAIQYGIPVARMELMDEFTVRSLNDYSKLDLPVSPLLLLEFHGTEPSVKEQAELFGEIAAEYEGGPFSWTVKPEERSKLWKARHDAFWAVKLLRPGVKDVPTDICVPISRLAECVDETRRDLDESNLLGPIFGHAGDGNFHINLLIDMDDADEVARMKAFMERMVHRAIDMEGTCTGEHGIGQEKRKYLEIEYGREALDLMLTIKKAIDPLNIMNPGKIVTWQEK